MLFHNTTWHTFLQLIRWSTGQNLNAQKTPHRGEWWTLQWRHNEHDGVSNHQPHHCLLNRLFGCRSKKTSKLRVTGLCAGNSPGTGEFPAQMSNSAENVSIWWCHHGVFVERNSEKISRVIRWLHCISLVCRVNTPLEWGRRERYDVSMCRITGDSIVGSTDCAWQ